MGREKGKETKREGNGKRKEGQGREGQERKRFICIATLSSHYREIKAYYLMWMEGEDTLLSKISHAYKNMLLVLTDG